MLLLEVAWYITIICNELVTVAFTFDIYWNYMSHFIVYIFHCEKLVAMCVYVVCSVSHRLVHFLTAVF